MARETNQPLTVNYFLHYRSTTNAIGGNANQSDDSLN